MLFVCKIFHHYFVHYFFFLVRHNADYLLSFVNKSKLSPVDVDIWDFDGQHLYYARPFVADTSA